MMTQNQVRALVDLYCRIADSRKHLSDVAAGRYTGHAFQASLMLTQIEGDCLKIERRISDICQLYVKTIPEADWAAQIAGVGPVYASAYTSVFESTHTNGVLSLWRLCGVSPRKQISRQQAVWIVDTILPDGAPLTEDMIRDLAQRFDRHAGKLKANPNRHDVEQWLASGGSLEFLHQITLRVGAAFSTLPADRCPYRAVYDEQLSGKEATTYTQALARRAALRAFLSDYYARAVQRQLVSA